MGGLFSSPAPPPAPPAPPPPPTRADEDVQDAALQERRLRAKARGRASTILTSGQGVVDEVQPASSRLLGD